MEIGGIGQGSPVGRPRRLSGASSESPRSQASREGLPDASNSLGEGSPSSSVLAAQRAQVVSPSAVTPDHDALVAIRGRESHVTVRSTGVTDSPSSLGAVAHGDFSANPSTPFPTGTGSTSGLFSPATREALASKFPDQANGIIGSILDIEDDIAAFGSPAGKQTSFNSIIDFFDAAGGDSEDEGVDSLDREDSPTQLAKDASEAESPLGARRALFGAKEDSVDDPTLSTTHSHGEAYTDLFLQHVHVLESFASLRAESATLSSRLRALTVANKITLERQEEELTNLEAELDKVRAEHSKAVESEAVAIEQRDVVAKKGVAAVKRLERKLKERVADALDAAADKVGIGDSPLDPRYTILAERVQTLRASIKEAEAQEQAILELKVRNEALEADQKRVSEALREAEGLKSEKARLEGLLNAAQARYKKAEANLDLRLTEIERNSALVREARGLKEDNAALRKEVSSAKAALDRFLATSTEKTKELEEKFKSQLAAVESSIKSAEGHGMDAEAAGAAIELERVRDRVRVLEDEKSHLATQLANAQRANLEEVRKRASVEGALTHLTDQKDHAAYEAFKANLTALKAILGDAITRGEHLDPRSIAGILGLDDISGTPIEVSPRSQSPEREASPAKSPIVVERKDPEVEDARSTSTGGDDVLDGDW